MANNKLFTTDNKSNMKMIFTIFVGAIVAATLIVAIADQVNLETSTFRVDNTTVTAPAVNATLDLVGRGLVTRIAVLNATNVTAVDNINMILQTGTGTTGLNSVQLTLNDSASEFAGKSVNVSYTYEPDGFVSNASGGAIVSLITLFAALGLLVFVIALLFTGTLGELIKRG